MEYCAWSGLSARVQKDLDELTPESQPALKSNIRTREKLRGYSLVRTLTKREEYTDFYGDSYGQTVEVKGRYLGIDNAKGKHYNFTGKERMEDQLSRLDPAKRKITVFTLIQRENRRFARWMKRQAESKKKFQSRQQELKANWDARESARIAKLQERVEREIQTPRRFPTDEAGFAARDAWLERLIGFMVRRPFRRRLWRQRQYRCKWYDYQEHQPLVPCQLGQHPRNVQNSCIHVREWTSPTSVPIDYVLSSDTTWDGGCEHSKISINGRWVRLDVPGVNTWTMEAPKAEDLFSSEELAKIWAELKPRIPEAVNLIEIASEFRQTAALLEDCVKAAKNLASAGWNYQQVVSRANKALSYATNKARRAKARYLKGLGHYSRRSSTAFESLAMWEKARNDWQQAEKEVARLREFWTQLREGSAVDLLKSASNAELLKRFGVESTLRDLSPLMEALSSIQQRRLPKKLEQMLKNRGVVHRRAFRTPWESTQKVHHVTSWDLPSGPMNGKVKTKSWDPWDGSWEEDEELRGQAPPFRVFCTGLDYDVNVISRTRRVLSVYCSYDFVDRFGWRIDDSIVARGMMLDSLCLNGNLAALWEIVPYSFAIDWVIPVQEHLEAFTVQWMKPKVSIQEILVSKREERIAQGNPVSYQSDTVEEGDWATIRTHTHLKVPVQRTYRRSYVRHPLPIDDFLSSVVDGKPVPWLKWPSFSNGVTALELWSQFGK